MQINVYPLPPVTDADELKDCTVAVIDVLRATTVTVCAVNAGAKDVIPMLDIEQARQRKAILETEHGLNSVILGGERHGLPISGFDLGNSPQHYTPEKLAGKILILTTTNGTVAMHAARKAKAIYAAAFVNAEAVVEQLDNDVRKEARIAIICAGTDGAITEEDLLLAGCLVSRLVRRDASDQVQLNDHAEAVQRFWEKHFFTDNAESVAVPSLIEILRAGHGGRNLIHLGLDSDIVAASQIDSIKTVPKINFNPQFQSAESGDYMQ